MVKRAVILGVYWEVLVQYDQIVYEKFKALISTALKISKYMRPAEKKNIPNVLFIFYCVYYCFGLIFEYCHP
jgi:hypothetical protein